jgi:hypothetical protein
MSAITKAAASIQTLDREYGCKSGASNQRTMIPIGPDSLPQALTCPSRSANPYAQQTSSRAERKITSPHLSVSASNCRNCVPELAFWPIPFPRLVSIFQCCHYFLSCSLGQIQELVG